MIHIVFKGTVLRGFMIHGKIGSQTSRDTALLLGARAVLCIAYHYLLGGMSPQFKC